MAEEYTPVLIAPDGQMTVLAVKVGAGNKAFSDKQLLAIKAGQENNIRENLSKHGLNVGALTYAVAVLDILPLEQNRIDIQDKDGTIVDSLIGSVGFEHDNNTWVYRKAGLLHVPADTRIILVDGEEYARTGDFYNLDRFTAIVAENDALSSTCAIGKTFIENWPRPGMGKTANRYPAPEVR